MNVTEAAEMLGLSPRRVRAMIADGRILAHQHQHRWVVDNLRSPKERRSLSPDSWAALTRALVQRSLEGLEGQGKLRTAARLRALRQSKHPSRLIADWYPKNTTRSLFVDSLLAHAEQRDDEYFRRILARPTEYFALAADLAQAVASERVIRGLSRVDLADAAGVPVSLVRDIEGARPLKSPGHVRRVLLALEIEATRLPAMELR